MNEKWTVVLIIFLGLNAILFLNESATKYQVMKTCGKCEEGYIRRCVPVVARWIRNDTVPNANETSEIEEWGEPYR